MNNFLKNLTPEERAMFLANAKLAGKPPMGHLFSITVGKLFPRPSQHARKLDDTDKR